MIEQDHRPIKLRLGPMLGFKRFRHASITIAGIEPLHRSEKVNSTSASFASKTTGRPKSRMRFSPHKPVYASEHFFSTILKVCTTTRQSASSAGSPPPRSLRRPDRRSSAPSHTGAHIPATSGGPRVAEQQTPGPDGACRSTPPSPRRNAGDS